jgi:hypothetical protein
MVKPNGIFFVLFLPRAAKRVPTRFSDFLNSYSGRTPEISIGWKYAKAAAGVPFAVCIPSPRYMFFPEYAFPAMLCSFHIIPAGEADDSLNQLSLISLDHLPALIEQVELPVDRRDDLLLLLCAVKYLQRVVLVLR